MEINDMIRIATVFSGIGAPEQALKQLGVDHKIVFACDNGERYLKQTSEEIEQLIKDSPDKTVAQVVRELYDATKKANNVKTSYFANYDISEENWHDDIRFLDGKP